MHYKSCSGTACVFSSKYHLVKYRKRIHTGVRTTLNFSYLTHCWLYSGCCWITTPRAGLGLSVRTFWSFVNVRPNTQGRILENLNKQMESVRRVPQLSFIHQAKNVLYVPFPPNVSLKEQQNTPSIFKRNAHVTITTSSSIEKYIINGLLFWLFCETVH